MAKSKETAGKFTLKKPAKSSGGDRYTGTLGGESLDVYIPQVVSRPDGAATPLQDITITVS